MKGALIRPAPLGRRLAAALYDLLLVLALWFAVGFAALPFTGGEAVATGHPGFALLLYLLTALFYLGFWTHGGQTLGMRAWRLQLRREGGGPVDLPRALLRLLLALPSWGLAGLGLLAMYADDRRRALHDRYSGTEMVLVPFSRDAPRPPPPDPASDSTS